MLDELLELGTMFDWISPVLSIGQDIANGPSHTFLIPQECGWTGGEIAGLLRERGIKTWGHMIVNGRIMITVKKSQYEFARHLLDRNGLISSGEPSTGKEAVKDTRRSHGLGDLLREIGNIRL
jgi:hypothetical protein